MKMKILKSVVFSLMLLPLSSCAKTKPKFKCKKIVINKVEQNVCFPIGHKCTDPHGIGDGKPLKIDCWNSGSRMCHKGSKNWPVCAGGKIRNK